jgi:hypothetical protein
LPEDTGTIMDGQAGRLRQRVVAIHVRRQSSVALDEGLLELRHALSKPGELLLMLTRPNLRKQFERKPHFYQKL